MAVVDTVVAVQLVCAVDLVEERRAKRPNDGEEEHRRCDAGRLGVESLRLSLDGAEAHGEAGEE